jgi:hypothetical protein
MTVDEIEETIKAMADHLVIATPDRPSGRVIGLRWGVEVAHLIGKRSAHDSPHRRGRSARRAGYRGPPSSSLMSWSRLTRMTCTNTAGAVVT